MAGDGDCCSCLRECGRVNTIVSGATLIGHSRDWGRDLSREDAPIVRIRVLGVAGTVDVWRVPQDMRDASHDDIIRQLEGHKRLSGASSHTKDKEIAG